MAGNSLTLSLVAVIVIIVGCGKPNATTGGRPGKVVNQLPAMDLSNLESANNAVSDRVDELFRAINAGQAEQLYSSFTTPAFREAASLEKFRVTCDRVQSRLGVLTSKEPSRIDLNPVAGGLIAVASYEATFERGAGTVSVVFEKKEADWLLLKMNVNAPQLFDDPAAYRKRIELAVENSEPLDPGTAVDVLDLNTQPPKVILEDVPLVNVRWNVSGPFMKPKYPARGFITLDLTAGQAEAIESANRLGVRPHTEATTSDQEAPSAVVERN